MIRVWRRRRRRSFIPAHDELLRESVAIPTGRLAGPRLARRRVAVLVRNRGATSALAHRVLVARSCVRGLSARRR